MFVELIEALRCVRAHEDAHLVASATRTEARSIMDGVLGCPVCGAEYQITDGVARFDPASGFGPAVHASAEDAMRAAALLGLADPGGFAMLHGAWGAHAELIGRLTQVRLVLLNPPIDVARDSAAGIILCGDAVPLAPGSARALAIAEGASAAFATSAVQAVRGGGRIVGAVTMARPEGTAPIASDERHWVAEKTAATTNGPPRLVELRKAPR